MSGGDENAHIFLNYNFRSDLDALLPPLEATESNASDIELKPSIDIYNVSARFLTLFKESSPVYTKRLETLCRYLLATLASESPKLSYIGVALNKELSIAWIRHIKILLYKCCVCMQKLKPENHVESIILALYLNTLVSFTSPNTWAILKSKNLSALKPGMTQLCSNIMGALVQKGFFIALRVSRHSVNR